MRSKLALHATKVAGWLLLSLAQIACAAPIAKSTVHTTTASNDRLSERWDPKRGVQSVSVHQDAQGYVLHLQAVRVCRVLETERRLHEHEWESKPNTGMLVAELVMIGTGVGATALAWGSTKDECGSGDVLSTCDGFAHGIALGGVGLAAAGTAALLVDTLSAGQGRETSTSLGRAVPPHHAPCLQPNYEGAVVKLVAPNVTLSGVVNRQGVARLNVPDHVWVGSGGSLDLDVLLEGHIVGRVVMHKEAACEGC